MRTAAYRWLGMAFLLGIVITGCSTQQDSGSDSDAADREGRDSDGRVIWNPIEEWIPDTDSSSDGLPPSMGGICEEPEPWPLPSDSRVVGDGTAQSCTESALRDAVSVGGHVTFDCGNDPVRIVVHSDIIAGSHTVVDGEFQNITLDAEGSSRIFVAPNHGTLSVRHLRFINGSAPLSREADGIGGAVAGNWRSAVEVRNCVFVNNTAGRGGGAVSVWTGSELVIVASRFTRNRSFYGGAVYSLLSPLQIVNSIFDDNETIDELWGEGGAVGTDGASEYPDGAPGGTVEICGTQIRNNRGVQSGGGVYIWVYPPDQVIIDRVQVEENLVGQGGLGGGMRISNGDIRIVASSFLSNTSENHGGALYLDCAPDCVITNSTFHGNTAQSYGGAISCGGGVVANNVTFSRNSAGGHGGALFGDGYTVRNSIFVDNAAGNPWNQANSCGATGDGAAVLQWLSAEGGAGPDPCIENLIVGDPLLASMPDDNGGPTHTLMIAADSPARQAGTDCETMDQRGEPRNPEVCDLGAVERE